MLKVKNRKGQSTLEYAILVIIVIAALLSLNTYIKRGLSGRFKQATDDIGDQYSQAGAANYHKRTVSTSNTSDHFTNGMSGTTIQAGGQMTTSTTVNVLTNAYGEYWGSN